MYMFLLYFSLLTLQLFPLTHICKMWFGNSCVFQTAMLLPLDAMFTPLHFKCLPSKYIIFILTHMLQKCSLVYPENGIKQDLQL